MEAVVGQRSHIFTLYDECVSLCKNDIKAQNGAHKHNKTNTFLKAGNPKFSGPKIESKQCHE